MGRRRRRRSSRPAPETRIPGTGKAVMTTLGGFGGITEKARRANSEKAMFERFRAQLGDTGVNRQTSKDPLGRDNMMHNFNQVNTRQIQPSETGKFSTQAGLERLKANRPDFMKPRPMTNQGAIATNMAQTAQGKMMAPEGYKPQQSSMPGTLMGSARPGPGGKGAMRPAGKGGQRPTPQSMPTEFHGPRPQSGPQPRPQRPMGGGGKGMQRPAGFGGKGGQRPSPSIGRPNPYAGLSSETSMTPGTGMQAPNVSVQAIDPVQAAPMTKKAPAFKLRSPHSTTFKEMGSDNKKSAPTRKTSTGYKMPGFGKR